MVAAAREMLFLASPTAGNSVSPVAGETVSLAGTCWFLILKVLGKTKKLPRPAPAGHAGTECHACCDVAISPLMCLWVTVTIATVPATLGH